MKINTISIRLLILILSAVLLSACSGGDSGISSTDSSSGTSSGDSIAVNGSGVKGPLANALVTVYAFDADQEGFKKRPAIADARTNDAAAIVDLRLPKNPEELVLPLIFEFSSDDQTIDLTTGESPVIKVLRTAVTAETIDDIKAGKPVFATPLTTLAVDMAIIKSGPGATEQTFTENLDVTAGYVVSTLGFGMSKAVDIFKTPPVLSANDSSLNAQSLIAEIRTSVEAMAAIVVELQKSILSTNPNSSVSPDQILSALADDLSDGVINGLKNENAIAALRDVSDIANTITVDPSTLFVPGTLVSLNDVEQILVAEAAKTCGCDATTVSNYLANGTIDVLPKPVSLEITSSVEATLTDVVSLSNTIFQLTFSNPLDFDSVADVSNYYIVDEQGNVLEVLYSRMGHASNTVLLTTAPQGDMSYRIVVSNVIESRQPDDGSSIIAPGTPILDLSLKTAVATSNTRLVLSFSEGVSASAADFENYQILSVNDGKTLGIKGAALDANGTTVTLITDSQQDIGYTVSVNNVTTLEGDRLISQVHNTLNFLGSYDATTLPDAPAVVGAISTGNTTVIVTFSSAMNDEAENSSNYSIVQENVNGEAGALTVTGASFYGADRKTVLLTTLSQSEVAYQVTAVNVQDMHGQPIRVENSNFGYHTADTASFAGTPPGGDTIADFDEDGLLDNEEQRGWMVRIVYTDGAIVEREVTSDPTKKDTDGDGLDDRLERSLNIDPRTGDSDADSLGDAHEYNGIFSSPSMQDTDRDGLFDGEEVTFYKTSPILDDTDGDQILDGEEVILANRNPRIADLPQPAFEIESLTLDLDVRFDHILEKELVTTDEENISTTLTQARERTHSESHEAMAKVHAQYTYTNQLSIPGEDTSPFPKHTSTHELEVGAEASYTGTWSKSSVESTQKEYNRTLTTEEQVSEGETVSRRIEKARVSTLLYLKAKGDVAFTISDLQITALVPDVRNPGKFLPLATLTPDAGTNEGLENSFHLGPLADKIGPLQFTNDDVFPAQVERLQRDPTGVIFKISNYNIEDENGRKYAFSSQDVVDRTTTFVLDFGGISNKEGEELLGDSTEFYRVATSFGRTIASVADEIATQQQISSDEVYAAYGLTLDDDESLISYDLSGKNLGVVFHDVMQGVLGLKHFNLDLDVDAVDPSERLFSYATETNVKGVERIVRIRQIENNEEEEDPRQWTLLTPTGLILDAQLSFGSEEIKPDDQVLLPGTGISLAFVRDADDDGIPERLEYLHGCSDQDEDTDDDGLSDYQEVFGAPKNSDGAIINLDDKWEIDVKSVGKYEGFSSCSSPDTDDDGISDFMEYGYAKDLDPNDPEADEPAEITRNRLLATDAKSQDTDGDGVSDFDEINGYIVQLEFPRVTTGEDISECTDEIDDTTSASGILFDKVKCITDPLSPSSDADALPDGAEIVFHSDPTVKDAGDISDIDGDGLLGREETDGWPVTFLYYKPTVIGDYHEVTCDERGSGCQTAQIVDCVTGTVCKLLFEFDTYGGLLPTSDPTDPDTDGDGLWDSLEQDISLAPNSSYTGSTHPNYVDTDLDGRSDFEELMGYPYNPATLDASKPYQGTVQDPVRTNPLDQDSDRDGRSDGVEVNESWLVQIVGVPDSDDVFSNPNEANIDNDGLNDFEEYKHKTDPNDPNTDGDEDVFLIKDGDEIKLGLNPLDPNDMCVQITFTSFKVLHDFLNIDQGDVRGDVRVRRYSNGTVGTHYLWQNFTTYNTVDDGVEEFVSGTQYTTYALMSDVQSIQVSTTDFQFRPVAGSWWDAWDGNLVVKSSEFDSENKEIKFSYSKGFNGTGGSFEPYFNFKVMTGTDVNANPDETFCQGL